MTRVLFISDLHLSEDQPHLTKLFQHFLSHYTQDADALYILGDFFELWVGDDAMTEFHQSIFQMLKRLTELDFPVYFMSGNRDFLIGKKFAEETGCRLISDPSVIDLYGQKILLKHGDDLCLTDKKHLRYRRLSRNRLVQKIFLSLPLSWRNKIAQKLRKASKGQYLQIQATDSTVIARSLSPRQSNSAQNFSVEPDITEEIIPTLFAKHHTAIFIHGHTHTPTIHYSNLTNFPDHSLRIVLSDWGNKGNFLSIKDSGEMRLCYFGISI